MSKLKIEYIDRHTNEIKLEQVYAEKALCFLYGNTTCGRLFNKMLSQIPFLSHVIGWWQSLFFTKRKIPDFIKRYSIDARECEKEISEYKSFNDFFIRKLKSEARPIIKDDTVSIIPADGRYFVYSNIQKADIYNVKGKAFPLETLLGSEKLAKKYESGGIVIARLCPTDYHRFHFPCDCIPGPARLINGYLYSVNPFAIKQNITFLTENKRVITELKTSHFGSIQFIEVGATSVGTIHQTYTPGVQYQKGAEKGYFSFGGSSLILLFEPETITFDADLLTNSSKPIETLCFMGQSLGRKTKKNQTLA